MSHRGIVDEGRWVHCDRLLNIVSSALWSTCSLHFLRCFLFRTRGWINHPSTLNSCRYSWELRAAYGNQKRKYGKTLLDATTKKVHFRGDVPSWMHKICSLANVQLKLGMRWFAAAHVSCAEACYRVTITVSHGQKTATQSIWDRRKTQKGLILEDLDF